MRINARDSVGAEAMRRFDVSVVPTFLLVDAKGRERLRSVGRVPSTGVVLGAIREPRAGT